MHCQRHFEESVAGHCRTCNAPFCERCLVFAFGRKKPPYCIACAIAAGGVRSNAGNRVVARHAPVAPTAPTSPRSGPTTHAMGLDAAPTRTRRGLFRRRSTMSAAETTSWARNDSVVPGLSQLDQLGHPVTIPADHQRLL